MWNASLKNQANSIHKTVQGTSCSTGFFLNNFIAFDIHKKHTQQYTYN